MASPSKNKKTNIKKKSKSVKTAKKAKLENAPVEQYFILANGQPVKNVKELADVLEHVGEEVFNHHVTPDRNDFANWTRDVFKELELAEELSGIKDKNHARITLYKHVIKKLEK